MKRLRIKPHVFVLVVGVLVMLGAFFSGIFPRITEWHEESPISREVFVNIPDALYWAFYVTVPIMLLMTAYLVSLRFRNYERGAADDRRTNKKNVEQRLRDFRRGVWMQTLMRDPAAGAMHSCIYFGFTFLFIATVLLEIDHQLPESLKFLHGRTYEAYAFGADLAGVIFLVGIGWAAARRYIQRPYRIRIKTKPEDAAILIMFAVIGVSGFFAEGFRIALEDQPGFEKWSFVGYPLSTLVDGWSREHPPATRTAGCGCCTSWRSSRSS